jgi:hypothetical protein
MLILKENAANSVPTPPVGKDTFFIDDSGVPSIKNSGGNVTTFPTVNASNAQVVFMNGTSLSGEAALTYDFNNNVLNLTGNIAATNVKTDNLLYANGSPWDLSDPGGSNTEIQFNDDESFGGSAAFTFNKSSNVVTISGNANIGNIGTAQLLASANVTAPQLISNVSTGTAPLVVTSTTVVANLRAATSNVANTVADAAQPNITSVGTLSSLAVTGNVTAGNVYANSGTIGASLVAGTLTTAAQPNITSVGTLSSLTVTGNVSAGNVSGTLLTGTLATNAQPNITSVGTLTGLGVNGTITGVNITANTGIFSGNAAGLTNVPGGNIVGNISGNISNATHAVTANTVVDAAQPNITSVGTLTSVVVSGNANVGGLNASGNAIITGNLTVNGNVTYVNVETLDVEDPIISLGGGPNGAAPVSDDGKDRGTALQYFSGSAKTAFMGYDNSNAEFGMGNAVTITNDVVTFTSYGNLRVANIIGNGQALTGLAGANVTGQVGNALVAGTVYTNAQPNITSVGTLTSLTSSGNVSANNLNATTYITATGVYANSGTIGASFLEANNDVTANRNLVGGNVYANSGTVGAVTGSFSGNVSALGVKTDNYYYANGVPVDFQQAGGSNTQVQFNDADGFGGSAAFTFNKSSNLVSMGGGLSVSGNANVGNLGTAQVLASANVTAPQLISNVATGTAPLVVTSTTQVANLNVANAGHASTSNTVVDAAQPNITSVGTLTSVAVTGNVTAGNVYANSGTIGATNLTGTLTTAAQPNITSVGTLSSLAVTGNATAGNVYANSGTIGASLLTGTLTTASQPNITAVGTLSSLTVSGNAGANNFNATTHVTAGNVWANSGTVGASLLTGTLTTAAQPNITSVGTLTSLTVTGNVAGGNLNTAGKVVASTLESNVATGTAPLVVLSTTKVANLNADTVDGYDTATAATGNTIVVRDANGSFSANIVTANLSGNATTAGTVVTAAQPNITSVGTLTSLAVTGNVTAGNVYANSGTIGANVITGNTLTGNLTTAAQPNITSVGTLTSLSVTGNANVGNLGTTALVATGTGSFGGNVAMNSFYITGLSDPVNNQDAATKKYVDDVAQGLNVHDSCGAATPDTLANVTGGTITYNNGTGGVNANLVTTGSFNLIDGVNVQTSGTRILVKNEANAAHNGIYTWANSTTIVRATDFNSVPEVEAGDFTFVTAGTLYDNTGWVQTATVTTIGTDNIEFTQFSGAGTYNAGTGLTLLGSTFSVNVAQPTITSVGTLTGLSVNGNITAANITANTGVFTGNGSGLSALAGGNVTGQVANALVAGTVYTAAQPNITSVGTLTSLSVTGTASAGNLSTGGNLSVTGNAVISGNLTVEGNLVYINTETLAIEDPIINLQTGPNGAAPSSNSGKDVGSALNYYDTQARIAFMGWDVSNAEFGLASQASITNEVVTFSTYGNLRVGNIIGNGQALTGIAGGNVTGQVANALVAGTVYTAAQPNITSLGTLSSVAVTGNATAGNVYANSGTIGASLLTGTLTTAAQPNITSVGTLTSVAITGNATAGNVYANSGTIGASLLTGTLTTAAQPNITSVGTLTSLSVTGNITGGNLIGVFANGNSSIAIPAANGNINLNAGGSATPELIVTTTGANITGTLNATGNANVGNLGTAQVLASANVTAPQLISNVATGTAPLVVTSTTQVANLNVATAGTAGTVTTAAQPNITSVGTLTSLGVNGTVTAVAFTANTGVFTGNGSGLSALAGANVTGQVANALVAGTVYTAAQPNITSVGTLTNLNVSGNAIITGNLTVDGNLVYVNTETLAVEDPIINLQTGPNGAAPTSNSGKDVGTALNYYDTQARIAFMGWDVSNTEFGLASVATLTNEVVTFTTYGNLRVGNIIGNGQALTGIAGGNVTGQVANALVAGTVYTAAQPNITSLGTLSSVAVTGNATAGNVYANSGTVGASLLTGTLTTAAQPNITSVGTLTSLGVNGTVTAVAFTANTGIFTGNGSGLSSLTGANVTGTVSAATTAGTVTTAAQPNITSVGTLSSLSVTGNVACAAFFDASVNAAVSAAGTVQGNATVIASEFNVISTVASGAGVVLPTGLAGIRVTLINTAANACLVYPASGAQINSLGTNAAFSLAAGGRLDYVCISTTQWYTLNATYA